MYVLPLFSKHTDVGRWGVADAKVGTHNTLRGERGRGTG